MSFLAPKIGRGFPLLDEITNATRRLTEGQITRPEEIDEILTGMVRSILANRIPNLADGDENLAAGNLDGEDTVSAVIDLYQALG